jgi:hypothetical protein
VDDELQSTEELILSLHAVDHELVRACVDVESDIAIAVDACCLLTELYDIER